MYQLDANDCRIEEKMSRLNMFEMHRQGFKRFIQLYLTPDNYVFSIRFVFKLLSY